MMTSVGLIPPARSARAVDAGAPGPQWQDGIWWPAGSAGWRLERAGAWDALSEIAAACGGLVTTQMALSVLGAKAERHLESLRSDDLLVPTALGGVSRLWPWSTDAEELAVAVWLRLGQRKGGEEPEEWMGDPLRGVRLRLRAPTEVIAGVTALALHLGEDLPEGVADPDRVWALMAQRRRWRGEELVERITPAVFDGAVVDPALRVDTNRGVPATCVELAVVDAVRWDSITEDQAPGVRAAAVAVGEWSTVRARLVLEASPGNARATARRILGL